MNSSPEQTPAPARILVVVDDPGLAGTVARALRGDGHEVIVCSSGREALETAHEIDVDMVVLDMVLPDQDGVEVARRIRDVPDGDSFVPVVLLSDLTDGGNTPHGLKYADEYITKPVSIDELLVRARSMLRIRELQCELLQSRNRYRFFYQNIPEMCLTLDQNRCVWDCNVAFARVYGLAREDIMGRSILEFFGSAEYDELGAYLTGLERGLSPARQQVLRLLPAAGGEVPVHVSMRGVRVADEPGGPFLVLVMSDVTHSLELEEERRIARRQLYRSAQMMSIGTLAAGVAHELNNPLAAILGFSDALLHRLEAKGPLDTVEAEQYLGIIKSESLRCRDIIENLLRFSSDREPQFRALPLLECIESACALVGPRARKRRISIRNSVPSDVIVRADLQKLGQVFLNVLVNAIDFCPEEAAISIDLGVPEPDSSTVLVYVRDNGPGIPGEILPRIFDPFFTTKEVGQGLGMGLAICHKAMEECEGSIDVQSGHGSGTTVVLEIPKGQTLN